jgi:hypothetical protein
MFALILVQLYQFAAVQSKRIAPVLEQSNIGRMLSGAYLINADCVE